MANKRPTKDEKRDILTHLVGAFIREVRKTQKAPSASTLYKQLYKKQLSADTVRKFRAVMEATVAKFYEDGSAKLYRDNRKVEEVMPLVFEAWDTVKVPEAKKYNYEKKAKPSLPKREKPKMANLVYNEITGDFNEITRDFENPGDKPFINPLKQFSTEQLLTELCERGFKFPFFEVTV